MTIDIDTNSGFCFGVTAAIRKAEEELMRAPLYCLGDIVHNGQEVQRLENLGLHTIGYDELRLLHGARVLLRAHGEPPSTYSVAADNGIEIIDATCPVVKKLQERIRNCYLSSLRTDNGGQSSHTQIVIFGKVGHAEVIGLQGQTDNTAIVVESPADLEKVDFQKDICLFSQTTKSVEEFEEIVRLIKEKAQSRFEYHDTICRNVANRVSRLKSFAAEHEVVLFVGGKKSSNAKVLFEECLEANPRTYFVENGDDPTLRALMSNTLPELIGICGATSTPLWLMEQVRQKLLDYRSSNP